MWLMKPNFGEKSAQKSESHRETGNAHFYAGNYRQVRFFCHGHHHEKRPNIFPVFHYQAWPFYDNWIIFLRHKVRKLNSKKLENKEKQSLVGSNPVGKCSFC
jgi:hypothetical protein